MTNIHQKDMVTFVAKYSDSQVQDMSDTAFTGKMTKAVDRARKIINLMVVRMQERKSKNEDKIFDEAFEHHFELYWGYENDKWEVVQNVLKKTKAGLAGNFRLAALHDDEAEGVRGLVVTKLIPDQTTCSANKVIHTDGDYKVAAGSIHIDYKMFRKGSALDGMNMKASAASYFIVHEATHRWANTHDKGNYFWEGYKYTKIDAETKLHNADCYAAVALSIYKGKVMKKRDDILKDG